MENEEIFEELIEEEIDEEIEEEIEEGVEIDDNSVGFFSTEISSGEYDLQILEELQKSNQNWNLFLDSYNVDVSFSLPTSLMTGIYFGSANKLMTRGDSDFIKYVFLNKGDTITCNFINSSTMYYGFFDSLELGSTAIYSFGSVPNAVGVDFSYTAPVDGYFIFSWYTTSTNYDRLPYYVDGYYSTLESYTLSEIGNAITSVDNKVDGLDTIVTIETSLLLVTLFTFFLSAVRKFGKKVNRKGDL